MSRLETQAAAKRARSERLEARISEGQKELFMRAAALQGRSLTDFLIASAHAAALEIVHARNMLRLSQQDRQAFVSALLTPPPPASTLRRAAKRYRRRSGR